MQQCGKISRKHAEWKKPDTKECILYDYMYMKFYKMQNLSSDENQSIRTVVVSSQGTDWEKEQRAFWNNDIYTHGSSDIKMNQFLCLEPVHQYFYSPSLPPYTGDSGTQ